MGATEKNETIADRHKTTIFERLFKENYTRLYYYALSFIPDPETCKDIVSESFRVLWERFDSIKQETMLSYMFAHVHNLCIDHIRHQEVENSYATSYLKIVSEMSSNDNSENHHKDSIRQLAILLADRKRYPLYGTEFRLHVHQCPCNERSPDFRSH